LSDPSGRRRKPRVLSGNIRFGYSGGIACERGVPPPVFSTGSFSTEIFSTENFLAESVQKKFTIE